MDSEEHHLSPIEAGLGNCLSVLPLDLILNQGKKMEEKPERMDETIHNINYDEAPDTEFDQYIKDLFRLEE